MCGLQCRNAECAPHETPETPGDGGIGILKATRLSRSEPRSPLLEPCTPRLQPARKLSTRAGSTGSTGGPSKRAERDDQSHEPLTGNGLVRAPELEWTWRAPRSSSRPRFRLIPRRRLTKCSSPSAPRPPRPSSRALRAPSRRREAAPCACPALLASSSSSAAADTAARSRRYTQSCPPPASQKHTPDSWVMA